MVGKIGRISFVLVIAISVCLSLSLRDNYKKVYQASGETAASGNSSNLLITPTWTAGGGFSPDLMRVRFYSDTASVTRTATLTVYSLNGMTSGVTQATADDSVTINFKTRDDVTLLSFSYVDDYYYGPFSQQMRWSCGGNIAWTLIFWGD